MHTKDTAADQLAAYFDSPANYGHASNLVLEQYAPDKFAWLRPERAPDDDERWTVTQRGIDQVDRWAAERWLFGREVS